MGTVTAFRYATDLDSFVRYGIMCVLPSLCFVAVVVLQYVCVYLSRLWFPCVDSQSELCPWDVAVTVPVNLVAVASGELTDQVGQGRGE